MPIKRTVEPGDTTIGLSEVHGLFAPTIWDDPANAELKRKRKDMNVLLPGDEIVIPDRRLKEVSKPPEKKHRFRRKGIPAKFRMQVFDVEEPRANQDYQLVVDGHILKGTTDGQGMVEQFVSPTACTGELIIGPDDFRVTIDFGHLDPIDEVSGLQQRLNNLGYVCGEAQDEMNPETQAALRNFQRRFGLKETGEPDADTLRQLEDIHDKPSDFPDQATS